MVIAPLAQTPPTQYTVVYIHTHTHHILCMVTSLVSGSYCLRIPHIRSQTYQVVFSDSTTIKHDCEQQISSRPWVWTVLSKYYFRSQEWAMMFKGSAHPHSCFQNLCSGLAGNDDDDDVNHNMNDKSWPAVTGAAKEKCQSSAKNRPNQAKWKHLRG